jgi:hypothetical protein
MNINFYATVCQDFLFFIFLHPCAITLDFFPKDNVGKNEIFGPFSCGYKTEVLLYRRFPSERPTGPDVVPQLRAAAEISCDRRAPPEGPERTCPFVPATQAISDARPPHPGYLKSRRPSPQAGSGSGPPLPNAPLFSALSSPAEEGALPR